jgi:internalin A
MDTFAAQRLSRDIDLSAVRKLKLNRLSSEDADLLSKLTILEYLSVNEVVEKLPYVPSLKTLKIGILRTIDGIQDLYNLEYLKLTGSSIKDIGLLSGLTSLKRLNFDFTDIEDIGVLSTLTRLEWLSLVQTKVVDLSPLKSCRSLCWFIFELRDRLSTNKVDITPLGECTSLKQLILTYTPVIGFDSIGRCTSLESLFLNGLIVRRKEFVALSSLHNMRELILTSVLTVDNIQFVEEMPNLLILDISDTNVTDISPITCLKEIRYLTMNNLCDIEDYSPLSSLTSLVYLRMRMSSLSSLVYIKDLPIVKLDIRYTLVRDISALRDMKTLTSVYLHGMTYTTEELTSVMHVKNIFKTPGLQIQIADEPRPVYLYLQKRFIDGTTLQKSIDEELQRVATLNEH